ncbi:unnamed protein product [Prunus armeniaca]
MWKQDWRVEGLEHAWGCALGPEVWLETWKGWQVRVHLRWAQGEGKKASGLVCKATLCSPRL